MLKVFIKVYPQSFCLKPYLYSSSFKKTTNSKLSLYWRDVTDFSVSDDRCQQGHHNKATSTANSSSKNVRYGEHSVNEALLVTGR